MTAFRFKNFTFLLLIATLVWFSTTQTCYARWGRHWRHKGSVVGSIYKKKGKHHGGGHHHPKHPPPPPEEPSPLPPGGSEFNVLDYGAKGDGETDDRKAFEAAWEDACKVEASTMIVPWGYKFLLGPTSFSGSGCKKNIVFQLDGTILAPANFKAWGSGVEEWLEFTKLVGFTIKGKGTLDGRGSVWWKKSLLDSMDSQEELVTLDNIPNPEQDLKGSSSVNAKMPRIKPTVRTALRFAGGADVTVTGITIQNSPQFHLTFDNYDGVLVYGCSISSPGDSPNTDGIHLHNSNNVIIHDTDIACGDDCISIQTGCTNVLVHDVNCGPGHGISIGSLGLDGITACVSNITVRDINMHNTMNGVRIKTWQGGEGLVQGVLFSNIQVSEVQYPIMIDQYYCDHSSCKNQTSAVGVSNIAYERIQGTYTVQPVHLACSDSKPCMDLILSDIGLEPKPNGHKIYGPFCWQAFGKLNDPIIPAIDCLQEGQPSKSRDLDDSTCAA